MQIECVLASRAHGFAWRIGGTKLARVALFVARALAFCTCDGVFIGFALKGRLAGSAIVTNTRMCQLTWARVDTFTIVEKSACLASGALVTSLVIGTGKALAGHLALARGARE